MVGLHAHKNFKPRQGRVRMSGALNILQPTEHNIEKQFMASWRAWWPQVAPLLPRFARFEEASPLHVSTNATMVLNVIPTQR